LLDAGEYDEYNDNNEYNDDDSPTEHDNRADDRNGDPLTAEVAMLLLLL
jgi:hypothetical protein